MAEQYITPGKQIAETLVRFFNELHPFRDAEWHEEFNAIVKEQDWEKGVRGCPTRCALHRSLERMFDYQEGEPGYAILHTIAYVAFPEPTSHTGWKVLRYYLNCRTHTNWDNGHNPPPKMVRFRAASPARRLEARREVCARHRLRHGTRRAHVKSPPTVLAHTLPRGYEAFWAAGQTPVVPATDS